MMVIPSPEDTASDVITHLDKRSVGESVDLQGFPSIRSGSYADIGPRRYMEDEHIRIDDLSPYTGSLPYPTAFYGNPQIYQVEAVEDALRKAFLSADFALADEPSISASSGTTALTALLLGRLLVVANAGDCRAVLCRKGKAINMSQDHRPTYPSERTRIEELGGFVDDGYLNGVVSVTRALGDWDMKFPRGSASPLTAEPEFQQMVLTEEDEFLIIGCDGVWDVVSSQQAVNLVRRGLRRHDDPEQCAKDLVREALRLNTYDNLTVIVICLTSIDHHRDVTPQQKRCCSISTQALYSFKSLLKK